jgi:hypothetical protein
MVQPHYVEAEIQSARAQQAVRCRNARVAARIAIQTSKSQSTSGFSRLEARVDTQTSKSQSKPGFSRLQVAIEAVIEALKVFKSEVAESNGHFPSAFREPEQGYGRCSRGNASGSGEQNAVQQPGLSELIAELARSAADLKASGTAQPVQGRPR